MLITDKTAKLVIDDEDMMESSDPEHATFAAFIL